MNFSKLCLLIVLLTAILAARIITSQAEAFPTVSFTSVPTIHYSSLTTVQQKVALYARKYHIEGKLQRMLATIKCESGFSSIAWNHSDPYGGSQGIAQFLPPTFNAYAKILNIQNPDIWNVDQQLDMMAYMWSQNQEDQWSCYRILYH